MIFRQKKIKKKTKINRKFQCNIFFGWILFHNPNTPHISSQTTCIIPNSPMSSQTLNVIPNLLRDLIIVPQNRSFQASLSGHPPRRRKLLLRWTAPQALQSLPIHKNFYAHKNTKKNCIKELLPKTENQFSSCVLSQEEVDLQEYHIGAKDLVTL